MKEILLSIAVITFVGAMAPAFSGEDILREDHPETYVVQEGDTLWDVASMFLEDAWMWPEIWAVNDIENPHLIFPGDLIVLTYADGKPLLTVQRAADRTARVEPLALEEVQPIENVREEYTPVVRSTPIVSAIPAIPLDAIASLLTTGRIVEQFTLDGAPHILAGKADRLVFGPGDEFYARGVWTSNNVVYGIFRPGNTYVDPETRDVLGFEAQEVGLAKVIERDGDIYTLQLVSVNEEIRIGDRLMPTEERRVQSTFFPKPPDRPVTGVIMTVMGGVTQVGKNNVVTVNRGSEDGLNPGIILAIHKAGKVVRDRQMRDQVRLPSERAGLAMVFRTFDRMSYALVLQTREPLRIGDEVTNP